MKKITLVLITLFAAGTMLMAQGGPKRGDRDHKRGRNINIKEMAVQMTEKMAKEYSLNDTQKRQVYEANLIMIADMQPAPHRGFKHKRDSIKIDKRDMKGKKMEAKQPSAEMKQAREAYEAKIKSVLTKEQYEAWTKNQAERQKRMEERRAERSQNRQKDNSRQPQIQ